MAINPVSRSLTPRSTLGKDTINQIIGFNYGQIDNEHTQIFETYTSNKRYEEDVAYAGLGTAAIKKEGESVFFDTFQETFAYRYEHDTVAIGIAVTEEQKEDNLHFDAMAKGAMWMARAMANTKQQKASNVLNNGFSSTYNGADGVPLFSANHPTLKSGNYSNYFAVDLSEDAIENMVIAAENLKDDAGILIGSRAKNIIVPPALQFKLYRILNAQGRVATADNDPNALRGMNSLMASVTVNHRLTDTDAFFLRTTVTDGLKHFVRTKLQTAMDGDFNTGNFKAKCRERYAFGWSDPRAIIGSEGA